MPTQIYFVDSKLDNYQTIINSLASTDIYYLIDSSSNSLTQMSNILSNYSNLDSIHVYSHGDVGSLNIGNTVYDNTNISNYKIELENIGKSLSSTGDILLYGCNVGQDEVGKNFINQIAQFSQADVAASNDSTGNKVLGGDWDLEVSSGVVEIEVKTIENYELTLGTITAIPLTNGVTVNFDKTSLDNYYSFTLNSAGKVLISGTDGNGGSIKLDIYDSNFNKVDYFYALNGSGTTSLLAGTYYINAIDDTNGGKFYIASNKMSGGTIPATQLINGQIVNFDTTSWDNHYSFTLNSAGKVLISGTDGNGGSIKLDIYDSNFNKVDYFYALNGSGTTVSLLAGTYYINAIDSTGGGKFYIASNKMSGGTIPATQLINGQIVNFDTTSWDNHYSFTLNSAGKVLISGTDGNGGSIKLDIYDSNFNKVDYFYALNGSGTTVSLLAGTYYINAIDSTGGGSFSISSTAMSGNAPTITSIATGTVKENALTSTVIYKTIASDVDKGSVLKYSLSGTDASLLNINSKTGVVKLKTSANYEDKDSYNFSVTVNDGTLSSSKDIIVDVTNVNEAPKITSSSSGSVAENSELSTVIYAIEASDVDVDTTLTYRLSGKDASLLNIDSETGEVTLKSLANYEAKSSYSFNVIASDRSLTATKTVVVSVSNVNEAPTITSIATGTVKENALTSTVIYKTIASDVDKGTILKYSLDGTDADLLNISSTGVVTLKSSADCETKQSYSFNVIANDGSLTATKAVVVNVTNINEAPIITSSSNEIIEEYTNLTTVIYKTIASDVDADTTLKYSLSGKDVALLNIDSTTGEVTLKSSANYETKSSYSFNIMTSDGKLSATKAVTVAVSENVSPDTIESSVTYTLSAHSENLDLTGILAINGTGNALGNTITGNDSVNKLSGLAGDDILNGGLGKDIFVFNTTLNGNTNKDVIKDFNVIDDTIHLSSDIFTKLATGTLNSDNFVSNGTKAIDANDYLIYNKTNGQLFYDADGSGTSISAVQIALIGNKATLTYTDFTVI